MADFILAYQKIIQNEGLFSDDPDDSGGRTFLGIAENKWPDWEGWAIVNTCDSPKEMAANQKLQSLVQQFYLNNFWNKIGGDQIMSQEVADSIVDFAVNAGSHPSIQLAQKVVGTEPDGIIGSKTIYAINTYNPKLFIAEFKLRKIELYCDIVDKKPSQLKYLKGWCRRTLK